MSGRGLLLRSGKEDTPTAVSTKAVPPNQERRHQRSGASSHEQVSFEDEEMQDDGEQISAYDMSYECQDLQKRGER